MEKKSQKLSYDKTKEIKCPKRGFPAKEFEARFKLAQQLMTKNKIDAIFITSKTNFHYYSGLSSQFWLSPTRPNYLIIPRVGKSPITVVSSIMKDPLLTTWLDNKCIFSWDAPCKEDDGRSIVIDKLLKLEYKFKRIGVPMGHEQSLTAPLNDFRLMEKAMKDFNGTDFVDCTDSIIFKQRNVKSKLEIEKMRYICELTSIAFKNLPARLEKYTLKELTLRQCRKEMKMELLELGADDAAYVVVGCGRQGYISIVDDFALDATMNDGDVLILDTGATWDNYWSDHDRNMVIGQKEATPEVLAAHDALWVATEEAIKQIKPGITSGKVWQIMADSLLKDGYDVSKVSVGRMGHGLGLELTSIFSNKKGWPTVLQEGTVMTLEPSLPLEGGGCIVHEEDIVVTKNGCELLSIRAPRKMLRVNIK